MNLGLKVGTSVNIVDFFKELDRRKGGEEYEAFIIVGQRHFLFPTYFPTNFPLVSFSSVHCNLIKCSRKEFLNLEKNFFYFPITHRLQTGKPRNKKKKKSKEQNWNETNLFSNSLSQYCQFIGLSFFLVFFLSFQKKTYTCAHIYL